MDGSVEEKELCGLIEESLHGYHTIPVMLKMILDEAFSRMSAQAKAHVLANSGWTPKDYDKSYKGETLTSSSSTKSWNVCKLDTQIRIVSNFTRLPQTSTVSNMLLNSLLFRDGMYRFNQSFIPILPLNRHPSAYQNPLLHSTNNVHGPEPQTHRNFLEVNQDRNSAALRAYHQHIENLAHFEKFPRIVNPPLPTISSRAEPESVQTSPLPLKTTTSQSIEEKPSGKPCNKNKRRVSCHLCGKTYCDKGALKIHISAVHEREMHKCLVKGCNQVFSSRRSRNRHSANPNPKLHDPCNQRSFSIISPGSTSPTDTTVAFPQVINYCSPLNAMEQPLDPQEEPLNLSIRKRPCSKVGTVRSALEHLTVMTEQVGECSNNDPQSQTFANGKTCEISTSFAPEKGYSLTKLYEKCLKNEGSSVPPAASSPLTPVSPSLQPKEVTLEPNVPSLENGNLCGICGKKFQNRFSVKTHFQNVHLRVPHQCYVRGCNASFPSKRSRDRHSRNQNLHRRLLSKTDGRSLKTHPSSKFNSVQLVQAKKSGDSCLPIFLRQIRIDRNHVRK